MAVQLINGAEFLHIPKTGGNWVKSVLEENELISKNVGHAHADYDRNLFRHTLNEWQHLRESIKLVQEKLLRGFGYSENSDSGDVFRFCFVRHPLSWYESWWKYMGAKNWPYWGTQNSKKSWHPNSTLNGLGSTDFNEFVRNVVRERPGYVSELLFAYTKPGISFVGKTENLREDLSHVLDILGLQYDSTTVEESSKVNVSKTDQKKIRWDPNLKKTVMRLELPALLHFGYLSAKEKNELGIEMKIPTNKALHRRNASYNTNYLS